MGSLTEREIYERFKSGFSFPPLEIQLAQRATSDSREEVDAVFYVNNGNDSWGFVAEIKSRNTPRAFDEAIAQVKAIASDSPNWPMVVVPYLREERLRDLEKHEVSGIDLCGNGLVSVPGKLFVYRTGQPNKFPESRPSKYTYRGKTSLVARALLLERTYAQLSDVQQKIEERGAAIAISTISKALKRLEDDIIIERRGDGIYLLQQEQLLDNLAKSYTAPKVTARVTCRAKVPLEELLSDVPIDQKLALSGKSSINAYAVLGRDEYPRIYTDNAYKLLNYWGENAEESSRFIDFELQETSDPTVYFDSRRKANLPYASPVQTYLDCSAGDKREKEAALQMRDDVFSDLDRL